MKRIRILIFLGGFLVFFLGATYILRANSDRKQRFANFYYEPEYSIDVVYIGSSPVHPYWSPALAWELQGFTSASLATNVQQPKAALCLLREVEKTQSPDVMIFELRMFSREQKEFDKNEDWEAITRNVTDNMKYSFNRVQTINRLVPDINDRISYYFDIMKYHSLWKHLGKEQWEYWKFEKPDPLKGHLIMSDVVDLSYAWHDYRTITEVTPMPPEQEMYLRELLDYCKEKEIMALFTVNPYTDITETAQAQFNYMQQIVEQEYGYDFINFNCLYEELGIDFAKDFYNGGHMNACGAEKFTAYLAKYLSENYDLPDKREDPDYAGWNKAYAYWKEQSDNAVQIINDKVAKGAYDE